MYTEKKSILIDINTFNKSFVEREWYNKDIGN